MTFNVGDFIIMKRGAPYSYTKYKSTGVVLEVGEDQIYVEFDYLSGDTRNYLGNKSFWVDIGDCKLTKMITQQEKVINKIKQIEARWVKFQEHKGTCRV